MYEFSLLKGEFSFGWLNYSNEQWGTLCWPLFLWLDSLDVRVSERQNGKRWCWMDDTYNYTFGFGIGVLASRWPQLNYKDAFRPKRDRGFKYQKRVILLLRSSKEESILLKLIWAKILETLPGIHFKKV